VSSDSPYLHAVDGRIRVKIAGVKGSPERALEIEKQLRWYDGIDHVMANPTTGSVLILYNSECIQQRRIMTALRRLGWLTEPAKAHSSMTAPIRQDVGHRLAESLVTTALEFAVKGLVAALI